MKKLIVLSLTLLLILLAGCTDKNQNRNYNGNPEPLYKNAYIRLPLGSVKPEGWLKSQLEAQAAGLTGNLDDFWPDLVNSSWRGGAGEAWERGPYYLDGLVPLAYLLDDQRLIEKAKGWIENIIASSSDSGWYGPAKNKDRWPLAVANKVLMQYYEATGDKRAIEVLKKYFKYLHDTPPDWPDDEWRGERAMENAVTGYWLFRQLKEPWILETIESIQKNSNDWTSYYEKFPWDSAAVAEKRIPLNWRSGGTAHVVNNAMAIKFPGLWYQQSKDERYKKAVFDGLAKYDRNHGQVGGRFSGDEHLSGNSPNKGTELCSVVELMFSLQELYEIFGDNKLADRLEALTFNSLPGTTTPDIWAHQYDQQSNQVLVSASKRDWSNNGDNSNIYGLKPNFACCLANMHQGWPKFVGNMWMASNDNGLVAVAYGPSRVKAKVGNGREVTIIEETEYPFRGQIKLTIRTDRPVKFPISLRIPGWAEKFNVAYLDKTTGGKTGSELRLEEKWKDGDVITIDIPLKIRFEERYNRSASIMRGPLWFSLRIDKEYKQVKIDKDTISYKGTVDWQISPKSDWNYGLILNKTDPGNGFIVKENPIGKYPFADYGDMVWSSDSARYVKWTAEAPVVIKSRGYRISEWQMKNNSADIPPPSPVKPKGDPQELTLVPYGSAKLRITEFPVMDIIFMSSMVSGF